jgi:hypothetical protein
MPTGSLVARQPDDRPLSSLNAHRRQFVVTHRPALVTFAVVLMAGLRAHTLLAAPIMTGVQISGVRDEVVWPILFGTVGIAVFLALREIVRVARIAVDCRSNRKKVGDTPPTSVDQFVEDAQRLHIDPQIARETFQLLVSLVPEGSSVGINDELRATLQLLERQISSLLSALPELCDRARLPANAATVLSVYDLLHHIESSPKTTSGQFYSRTSAAIVTPLASPLADLKNASPRDSRFRTRAHFSGVKRRASDYSGPYRRATDRRPNENYIGPLRRASDLQDTNGDQRTGDRRSSERRAVVSQERSEPARQHRAVSADTSLLNQCLGAATNQAGTEPERDRRASATTRESVLHSAVPLQRH